MSFFNYASQNAQNNESRSFSSGGSNQPIPEGTRVKAFVERVQWNSFNNENYIDFQWRINGDKYNNFVIFQKIYLERTEEKERMRAFNMLLAIVQNGGNKLLQAMRNARETMPSDNSLATLKDEQMMLTLGVWKNDETGKTGNFVRGVSPLEPSFPAGATDFPPKAETPQHNNDLPWEN